MRKGAAGSCRDDPKFRNRVGSTFADVTYSVAPGLPPRGFFIFRCRWTKRTIKRQRVQEIVQKRGEGIVELKGGFQVFFTTF